MMFRMFPPSAMNYDESVRFLYSLGNEVRTAKLSLERITALLHAFGDPLPAPAVSSMWLAPMGRGLLAP